MLRSESPLAGNPAIVMANFQAIFFIGHRGRSPIRHGEQLHGIEEDESQT
jgi:hypothetical protein